MTWIAPTNAPDSAAVAAHYDREDPLFRALWGDHLHHGVRSCGGWARGGHAQRAAAAVERIAGKLDLHPGARVLDVGCGYGGPAMQLAREHRARVTGLTLSRVQFERARELSSALDESRRPQFRLGDWLENEFVDDSFDAALTVECFGHVVDKARFLSELRRVLVPGGRCVLVFWAAMEEPGPKQKAHLEKLCVQARLPSIGSEVAVQRLAEQAGLVWSGCEDWSREVLGTWPRAIAHTAWLTATRRQVRARVLGLDGESRLPAAMAFGMMRGLREGNLRYLAAECRVAPQPAPPLEGG